MNRSIKISIILLTVILIAGVAGFGLSKSSQKKTNSDITFCATDVRECPNGSYISRIPPSCDFAQCPNNTATTSIEKNTCKVGDCPFDIYSADNGKVFTYTITSRFTIFLSEEQDPEAELKVVCTPQDSMGRISNVPAVTPPLYAVRYEAVKLGSCSITNRDFAIKINITD